MKSPCRHILSILALFAYIAGGALLELTHHDEANLFLNSRPVLSSHDCGRKEIHVPLDDARHCLACTHSTHRVSTQATPAFVLDAELVCTVVVLRQTAQLAETDFYHTGKRGPPLA